MRGTAWSLTALLAGCAAIASAQLVDPTRPPPAPVTAAEMSDGTVRTPVLQSIMIGPRSRVAIIDGERVTVGGSVGGARVEAIEESTVVLRSRTGTEVLRLYPDVHMKSDKRTASPVRKTPRN